MTSLYRAIAAHGAADPGRIALDPGNGSPVTYAALTDLVGETAAILREMHGTDTPVALQLDYGTQQAITELALLEAGIPVLSLPLFFTAEQARHAITTCGARMISDRVPNENSAHGESASFPLSPLGTARITFTSGSTGNPKGVCLSAEHLLSVASAVVDAVGTGHAGRHLALLPPGILLETVAGFFATLLAGGTYVCPPQAEIGLGKPFRPDFVAMLDAIDRHEITSLILVPEYLAGLVTAMESSGRKLERLTLVAVGGAHTSLDLLRRARALGLPVRQGYGLTECASVVALEGHGEGAEGSVGRPLGHMQVHIADDGEVLLDGPLCLGTLGEPREPRPLATGDLGRIDAQGRLWIEGRKSSLIVTGFGRNISPEWIEASLVARPEIAQAMVYGDGLPAPEALLVPAAPHVDLAAAVDAVNNTLPDYARIAKWREAAHFTPGNGQLTGNGRLRRAAISATYCSSQPDFFVELEAATVRERLAFLSIPQLQAGLNGTIPLQAYLDYLAQAYHHVKHTVPLMWAAHDRLCHRPELITALNEYIAEEEGHEEWILSDIAHAGGDAEAVRHSAPDPATAAMVDHAYHQIRYGNPVALFGMVYVLESVSVALAQRGASAVADTLGLPPKAFTYLTSHGALDQQHMAFFARLVNSFTDPADRDAVVRMAKDMFALFGGVFASIELEPAREAA
ncbi:AMP-dependent synthetase [Erythrobacter sp. SG61-1L]|uniref:AMP-binding protein n=1 Tax=Erythrobacter sp. SG61-1L TaxID=1603897 RepID=UPI0006C922CF|nr:AMP-binding protein [Erythrobacter sp. SG61-1L]KPL68465.1 AMP-dependent synthetase [Erythrobacter sp. SG61-1L]